MLKKIISFCTAALVLVLLSASAFASTSAVPTASAVLVDGKSVSFEAYNIGGSNYFKLRDLAQALNGSEKQFDVSWNSAPNAIGLTTGTAYKPAGGELISSGRTGPQPAAMSSSTVYVNGTKADLIAYNIGGNNYFKLRDIGSLINFGIGWDAQSNTITIDTSVGYTSEYKNLTVNFLNVGQGDSEFIELPNGQTMLIDAGNPGDGDNILKYITDRGYNKIDYLIATHPHADHIGGMAAVVSGIAIGSIYMPYVAGTTDTYDELIAAIQAKGLTVSTAKAGVSLLGTDDLKIDMLAPNSISYDDMNNYSAVIKLTYKNNSFLFMGDAQTLSENEMMAKGYDLKADVLKVGHHGSSTSTGTDFLAQVSPKYAVISDGRDNIYGHPAMSTLNKLEAIGATVYRTDNVNTTIVMRSDGTTIDETENRFSTYGWLNGDAAPKPSDPEPSAPADTSSSTDVDMTGWMLVSVTGNQTYTFPAYTLKAGGVITVASGKASGDFIWTTSYIWNNNSSDPAQLYDAQGNLVSTFNS